MHVCVATLNPSPSLDIRGSDFDAPLIAHGGRTDGPCKGGSVKEGLHMGWMVGAFRQWKDR